MDSRGPYVQPNMDSRGQSLVAARATEKKVSVPTKARANDKTAPEPRAMKGKGSMGNIANGAPTLSFTISGLLIARRLTKNLKERTALKIAAKKPVVTKIVNEKVPPFSSKPPQKFSTFPVQKFLEEYLPSKLNVISYDPDIASRLTVEMSNKIKEFAKGRLPPRYKLVCIVTVGERCQVDALLTSRALWDTNADTFVSHSYENRTMFCVASIFALYCE
ncbi:dynein light chain Tctex-type 5-like [Mobula hypostoma]|uniref:dynein light chain Tctex-type 5-like n=1 Tax=Mobula hypostoma TaxID=723540 RepID=UPI002FC29012